MNVTHVSEELIPVPVLSTTGDRLSLIFGRQRELMERYHGIEKNSGLLQTGLVPVDIHDKRGQARLKDFAWRVTEELTEATLALTLDHGNENLMVTHCREEIADAWHFLVELLILSGVDEGSLYRNAMGIFAEDPVGIDRLLALWELPELPPDTINVLRARTYFVVEQLGGAMNCLKNKPWKQTHQLTDVEAYRAYLVTAVVGLISMTIAAGMSADDLFRMYFKKSEVNKFRQRSNY